MRLGTASAPVRREARFICIRRLPAAITGDTVDGLNRNVPGASEGTTAGKGAPGRRRASEARRAAGRRSPVNVVAE